MTSSATHTATNTAPPDTRRARQELTAELGERIAMTLARAQRISDAAWDNASYLALCAPGTTIRQAMILREIEHFEDAGIPVAQVDVAERLEIDRTTMSRLTKILAERGHVRVTAESRGTVAINRISLTDDGLSEAVRAGVALREYARGVLHEADGIDRVTFHLIAAEQQP